MSPSKPKMWEIKKFYFLGVDNELGKIIPAVIKRGREEEVIVVSEENKIFLTKIWYLLGIENAKISSFVGNMNLKKNIVSNLFKLSEKPIHVYSVDELEKLYREEKGCFQWKTPVMEEEKNLIFIVPIV